MAVVWVVAEMQDAKPKRITLELLSKARELGEAQAIVLGPGAKAVAAQLGEYGACKVYVHEDQVYAEYSVLPAVETIARLIEQHQPALVLLGTTYEGRDLASRLSARLNTGIITNASDVASKDGGLEVTIPTLGGTTIVTGTLVGPGPKIVLLRPKSFTASTVGGTATIEEVAVDLPAAAQRAKVVESVVEAAEGPSLEDASIVVSGGRGIGGPEKFAVLHELADLLGGAVGATRAAVDAGWKPYSFQIGQTGKTVKPDLYIACGISGAIQHTVGMQGSKVIVAINKDPEAPIFKLADFGIVGNVHKVVPQLVEEVKRRKSE